MVKMKQKRKKHIQVYDFTQKRFRSPTLSKKVKFKSNKITEIYKIVVSFLCVE